MERVAPTSQLEHTEPHRRTDAEERDEHAELRVGRVQHLAHEHDAEREEGAEAECDGERGAGITARTSGMRNTSRKRTSSLAPS